jgi:hypothetical protein
MKGITNWLVKNLTHPSKHSQKGAINLSGMMLMGIAMVFIAVGFIVFPIVLEGTDAINDWTITFLSPTPTRVYTIDEFTGLAAVNGITPLLVLLGFVVEGAITGFMGIKVVKGTGSAKLDIGGIILMSIGLIFTAVALLMFPVALDGIANAYDAATLAATYTGLTAVLKITPLLILIAFVAGSVVTGFFGMKKIGAKT